MKELKNELTLLVLSISIGLVLFQLGMEDIGYLVAGAGGLISIIAVAMKFFSEVIVNKNPYFLRSGPGYTEYTVIWIGRDDAGEPFIYDIIKGEKGGPYGLYSKFTKALHDNPKKVLRNVKGEPVTLYYRVGKKTALPVEIYTGVQKKQSKDKEGHKLTVEELKALLPFFDVDAYKDLTDEKIMAQKTIMKEADELQGKPEQSLSAQIVGSGMILGTALILSIILLHFANQQFNKARGDILSLAGSNSNMANALELCQKQLAFKDGLLNKTLNQEKPKPTEELVNAITGG